MSNISRNIIRGAIAIKLLILVAFSISVIAVSYEQYNLNSSDFPENRQMAENKEGVIFYMILFLVPLALSVIVDFKEQKSAVLKGKWYLLTLSLITLYVWINQLKGQHYVGLSIATAMTVILALTIRKQNQSLTN